MSDIFDEAKLELENIKKAKVLKMAAYVFIVISIIAVLSTITYQWTQDRREKKVLAESSQFLSIFDNSDQKLSAKQIAELKKLALQSDSGFSAMSLLILAKQSYDNQQYPEFIDYLEKLSGNKSFDATFRDYAVLNLVNYYLSNDMIKQAYERILNIDIDASPYKSNLKLNLALIMIKDNKKDLGMKTLNTLMSDLSTPDNIIKDSKAMLYLIEKTEKNA